MDNRKKSFAIRMLRKASLRWRPRNEAKNEGRKQMPVTRNTKMGPKTKDIWHYQCALCPSDVWHRDKDIQLDHVEPAVPQTGWENFDSFIDRLFVETTGFQKLCKTHHETKTKQENELRQEIKNDEKPIKQTKGRKKKEQS